MTEDQIERAVERKTDLLDAKFMRDCSTMTQAEYDTAIADIARWAENEYLFLLRQWRSQ